MRSHTSAATARNVLVIVDEFTSSMDREAAHMFASSIGSFLRSLSSQVRPAPAVVADELASPNAGGLSLIVAGLFEDILAPLRPDWCLHSETGDISVLPKTNNIPTRCSSTGIDACARNIDQYPKVAIRPHHEKEDLKKLLKEPEMEFVVNFIEDREVGRNVWAKIFEQHHYMSGSLQSNGLYFLCRERRSQRAVGFVSSCHFFGTSQATCKWKFRENRLVVLPQWQGFGLGPRLSNAVAQAFLDSDRIYSSVTAHPRLAAYRDRQSATGGLWVVTNSYTHGKVQHDKKSMAQKVKERRLKERQRVEDAGETGASPAKRKPGRPRKGSESVVAAPPPTKGRSRRTYSHTYRGPDLERYKQVKENFEKIRAAEKDGKDRTAGGAGSNTALFIKASAAPATSSTSYNQPAGAQDVGGGSPGVENILDEGSATKRRRIDERESEFPSNAAASSHQGPKKHSDKTMNGSSTPIRSVYSQDPSATVSKNQSHEMKKKAFFLSDIFNMDVDLAYDILEEFKGDVEQAVQVMEENRMCEVPDESESDDDEPILNVLLRRPGAPKGGKSSTSGAAHTAGAPGAASSFSSRSTSYSTHHDRLLHLHQGGAVTRNYDQHHNSTTSRQCSGVVAGSFSSIAHALTQREKDCLEEMRRNFAPARSSASSSTNNSNNSNLQSLHSMYNPAKAEQLTREHCGDFIAVCAAYMEWQCVENLRQMFPRLPTAQAHKLAQKHGSDLDLCIHAHLQESEERAEMRASQESSCNPIPQHRPRLPLLDDDSDDEPLLEVRETTTSTSYFNISTSNSFTFATSSSSNDTPLIQELLYHEQRPTGKKEKIAGELDEGATTSFVSRDIEMLAADADPFGIPSSSSSRHSAFPAGLVALSAHREDTIRLGEITSLSVADAAKLLDRHGQNIEAAVSAFLSGAHSG
ncbi:unnamed protein product [Amoebophrya sp. A25]|nr:unnamed protein product [Amoebophrya sp. A25]|eukprot:GSA25T00013346001.1